jgi:hypothetical protein
MNKINLLIDEYVEGFIKIISDEYDISYKKLKNKWLSFIELNTLDKEDKVKDKEKNKVDKEDKVKDKEKNKVDKEDKVKDKEKNKVDKKDKEKNKVDKEDKVKDKEKNKVDDDDDDEFVVRKKNYQPVYSGVLIRLNRNIKKYVHRESGMIFYSKDELIVYAKILDNKLCKLTEEDKDICKKLKFRVDSSLYNEEDENYVYNDTNCIYNDIDNTETEF